MKRKPNDHGFTMMEMLIAVAVLVILMGLGFVAVQNYQRSMKQLELDKTARELFVAAQNHLTVAEAQGYLERRTKPDATGESKTRGDKTYHYYYVCPNDEQLGKTSVLRDMLPPFSIDDTVRLGGSYVIEYDLEGATVTNVFYSDQTRFSEHVFTSGDFEALFGNPGFLGDSKSAERLAGYGDDKDIIGWYGGESAKSLSKAKLYAPKVQLVNAERLEVKVSFTRTALRKMTESADIDAQLNIVVWGMTSGNQMNINQEAGKTSLAYFDADPLTKSEVVGTTAYRAHTYVLDDVTRAGRHFSDVCCGGTDPLIPGEDIRVEVWVQSTSVLSNVPKRAAGPTSSLFGEGTSAGVAKIANFRHLENLDPSISGYDLEAIQGKGGVPATRAEQTRSLAKNSDAEDLSWQGFLNKTGGTCVFDLAGTPSNEGTYLPVNPKTAPDGSCYLTSYDGKGQSVEGVKVNDDLDAGLFGVLQECEVKDLELIDFDVRTSSGSAGALVGSGTGLSIRNVLAHNTMADDSGIAISGSQATGGLVGQATDTRIERSAAAVYVKSTGEEAGGLVGKMDGVSTIEESYAGGHTKEGRYLDTMTGTAQLNVQAAADAGGLVGVADNASISKSYTTMSVRGGSNVGGLAGSATGGRITGCYSTGLVVAANDATKAGAFAGSVDETTVEDCAYFSLVNEGMEAVPGADPGHVDAFDSTAESYDEFFLGSQAARPYDTTLPNTYPFKGIEGAAGFAATHYGDWPTPEVLVANEAVAS